MPAALHRAQRPDRIADGITFAPLRREVDRLFIHDKVWLASSAPQLATDSRKEGCRYAEEIFGPVLTVLTFREPQEALQIANDTPYGLVAGIWTRDIGKAHWLAAQIKAGQIYINNYFGGGIAAPFGGYKKSGFGREKGLEALEHYTQVKNVCVAID